MSEPSVALRSTPSPLRRLDAKRDSAIVGLAAEVERLREALRRVLAREFTSTCAQSSRSSGGSLKIGVSSNASRIDTSEPGDKSPP